MKVDGWMTRQHSALQRLGRFRAATKKSMVGMIRQRRVAQNGRVDVHTKGLPP